MVAASLRPFFLLPVLAMLSAVFAQAAGTGCSRPIKVAFSPIGREMVVYQPGSYSGVAYDFLARLAERTGCKFQILSMPRARAWILMERGEVDVIPEAVPTARRDHFGIFVDHLMHEQVALMALKQEPELVIRSVADLIASKIQRGGGARLRFWPGISSDAGAACPAKAAKPGCGP